MQNFFPILADASSISEAVSHATELVTNNLPIVAFTQLLAVVAYWISSIVLAKKESHFLNAVKLWAVYLLGFIFIGVLAAGATFLGDKLQTGGLFFALKVVGTMLVLMVIFVMPMAVYQLNFARALAFVALSMILNTAGFLAASRFLGAPVDIATYAESLKQYLPDLRAKNVIVVEVGKPKENPASNPDERAAADRSKSIEERFAAVQRIYTALEERRATINTANVPAMNAYEQSQKRYQELLQEVQNAAAAIPPPGPLDHK